MAKPSIAAFICPVVVGREAELEAIDQHVAGLGRRVLLTSGEAGVGKSRLVAEARQRGARAGLRVLQGICFEPDRALPYAPLLEILRSLFFGVAGEEAAGCLDARAAPLRRLLPELGAMLPPAGAEPVLEVEHEKRRLFHAVEGVLRCVAAPARLLLVVEDLHWSDDTSLEFLLYLARRRAEQPALLVLTYRTDEGHPGLGHFLASLDRERLAVELALDRLPPSDVDAMLREILGLDRPVRPDFLHAVYGLTEGNPFFVEEVLRSLSAEGDLFFAAGVWARKSLSELRIPRSIQDAVQRRTEYLSREAREVLTLASIAGRRFDFALLQDLTRRDEEELLAPMKELIGAQLVVEESADRFAFRHALTQQAVYGQLLARERRALHRRVAEGMERLYADAPETRLGDLAYQYDAAGVWPKALEYARLAGERAQALHAPWAAVEHFTRALEAARQLTAPPLIQVHRARGLAYETLGDFDLARADHEVALAAAGSAGDRRETWQTLLDLGLLWAGRDYAQTGAYYRRALDLARQTGDPSMRAHSLNRLGNWHVNREEPVAGQPYHEEALAIFRELGDPRGTAQTLDLLGMTSYMSGDLVQGTAYYQQALAAFRELDDRQGQVSALATMSMRGATLQTDTVVPSAPLAESARETEQALRMAREIGWRTAEAYAMFTLGFSLGAQGAYGRALSMARGGLSIAEEIEHRQWMAACHCVLGAIYRDLLAYAEATDHLERGLALAREMGSLHWIRHAAGYLASVYTRVGQPARAEATLEVALDDRTPAQMLGQRLCWSARAELALARGDPGLVLAMVDRLVASAANLSGEGAIPRLWLLRAEALAALGQESQAEALLTAAQRTATVQGARPMLWRAHAAQAWVMVALARGPEAERESSAARGLVEELAAEIPANGLRETFVRGALASLPRTRVLSPRRAAKEAFGGLTGRERQVAALVARGMSSRAIAEELVVGERTVETHVENILAKLGYSSRAQIAAWAVEKGLTKAAQ